MASELFPKRLTIGQGQFEKLRVLLGALRPANPFYTAKYEAAHVPNKVSRLGDFFERFPFTLKQELVENQLVHPPFGTNLTYPLERYTRCHQTSGTAGVPLRWLDTPEDWDWMLRNWEYVHRTAGLTNSDRIFFAFSFGPFLGFWLAFEAALRLGCLRLPGGGLSSVARLRAILDYGATALCCTPTYAIRLAEVAAEEKIDLSTSRVKVLLVAGEPGGSIPATRQRLEQLWPGARVWDHHGMTEAGPVTYQCPARPCRLHVMESTYLAEVIDPASGRAAETGQIGELILTTLGRTGSPLLRYRTGDLVKPTTDIVCECGRSELALEGGILGRTDDMVMVRGVNVYPSAVEEIIRAQGGVAEYRVELSAANALTELNIQIEPHPGHSDIPALVHDLERAFENAFALRVPVRAVPTGALPRFEMKAKRWVRS